MKDTWFMGEDEGGCVSSTSIPLLISLFCKSKFKKNVCFEKKGGTCPQANLHKLCACQYAIWMP